MKLSIDTSDAERVTVELDGEKFNTEAKRQKAQKLLPFIEELLEKKGKRLKDLTEIKVNTGPGSFTGLRVGVAVANALGWSLGIPVNGQKVEGGASVKIIYKS